MFLLKLLSLSLFWISFCGLIPTQSVNPVGGFNDGLNNNPPVVSDSLGMIGELPEKMIEVLEKFSELKSKSEKINLLIEYSEKFREVPPEIAVRPFAEENEVKFCESGAYVWTILQKNGTLQFYFAVENSQGVSAKALSAILDFSLSGETPANVLNVPDDIVFKIFGEDLLKGKNMGLIGILQRVKSDAQKFLK